MVRLLNSHYQSALLIAITGALKVIHGQGMPAPRHHDPGDLYVKITVKFPEHIDPAVIPSLEAALPPRNQMDQIPKDAIIEECVLAEPERDRRRPDHDDSMEEDGDEPRVQCGNQ